MDILDVLKDPRTKWTREAPANRELVERLVTESAVRLPGEYLALLRYSNGGEGELGIEPGWFQLWPAEAVMSLNEAYEVGQNLPGFLGFGSNGGGELLAFDTQSGIAGQVYAIPFIPMTTEGARVVANDFSAFVRAMGHEYEDAQ